jgi:hypothetical protein
MSPSRKFIPIHGKHVAMKQGKRGGPMVGGNIQLLRPNIKRSPTSMEEMTFGGSLGANKFVGIVSRPPTKKSLEDPKPVPTIFKGGELLNNLNFSRGGAIHSKHDGNIKFLF